MRRLSTFDDNEECYFVHYIRKYQSNTSTSRNIDYININFYTNINFYININLDLLLLYEK